MAYDPERVFAVEAALAELLGPELAQVTAALEVDLAAGDHPFYIYLPEGFDIDQPLEVLASLVARSANAYARAARFAGMAKAEAKRARGRYERKAKTHREGKNEAERDRFAMESALVEHAAMVNAETIAMIAETFEGAARVGSESARKLLDKGHAMVIAQAREAAGALRDQDFR